MPIDNTPTEAVLTQVRIWAGLELHYRMLIEDLEDDERAWVSPNRPLSSPAAASCRASGITREARPNVLLGLHEQASQNVVRFAAEAIKAGIEERRVRLAEQQGALVADVIKRSTAT